MSEPVPEIEREIDLPPAIVWSALVDPELLAGWLVEVSVRDGAVELSWPDRPGVPGTAVRVIAMVRNERLSLRMSDIGPLEVRLEGRPGGLRGTWTLLRLAVADSRERWELALDRLEELLRGRPVDWTALRSDDSAQMSKKNNFR